VCLFGLGSKLGRSARRSSLGKKRATGFSLFGISLGNELLVGGGFLLVSEDRVHLFCLAGALSLKGEGSHQSLDLGGLVAVLALLGGEGTSDDVLANIVLLGKVEQFADVVGTLRTKTTGDRVVGKSLDGVGTDLGDNEVQDGNVLSNDASTDGLALALTNTSWSVGLVSLFAQQADTGVGQNTLTHRKTLLVISSTNAEDVSFEFLTQRGSVDLLGHSAFVKGLETLFIIDFDDFLHPSAGAGNINLHNAIDSKHDTIRLFVDCMGTIGRVSSEEKLEQKEKYVRKLCKLNTVSYRFRLCALSNRCRVVWTSTIAGLSSLDHRLVPSFP